MQRRRNTVKGIFIAQNALTVGDMIDGASRVKAVHRTRTVDMETLFLGQDVTAAAAERRGLSLRARNAWNSRERRDSWDLRVDYSFRARDCLRR